MLRTPVFQQMNSATIHNETAAVAILFAMASFCVFLPFANRFLLLMKDSRLKGPLLALIFVALTFGAFRLAFSLSPKARWILPVIVLAGAAAGEARRIRIRLRTRGSPPTETSHKPISLLRPVTTIDLRITHYKIILPAARPFRIAHLSDFHVSERLPIEYFSGVMHKVEEMNPDLVFLTGDFVTLPRGIPLFEKIIRPLGKVATLACLGNHDMWVDENRIAGVLGEKNITVLRGESDPLRIQPFNLAISACDDPWSTTHWSPPRISTDEVLFVLSHTPDNIYRAAKAGASAMFSGHCHAGQFKIPYFGSLVVPSIYGRRFDHGHFVVHRTHLFVTAGIGVAMPALRLYCHPDFFVVDVTQKD